MEDKDRGRWGDINTLKDLKNAIHKLLPLKLLKSPFFPVYVPMLKVLKWSSPTKDQ